MHSAKGRKDEVSALTADELRSQLVLKKMVGRGGFAAVYLGTYKGQEVAVKVILAEHVSPESSQVKLLLREGQYMSRCTHRNIVKCHAVCQLPADFPGIEALGHRTSTWALVLEYIGGGSLAALMMKQMSQTRRAYTDYEAYCWVRGIADALNHLHNAPRPVMHRDVKADNVLLTVDENGPVAKLMDFGLMAALDGKNPLLRRRSVSASSGGDGLGRTSSTPTAVSPMGGARNLSVPSVATYYNDSTHEPGKIFYLMEELPAPTVAALVGPAGLRRISVDFNGRNAGACITSASIATSGTSTPGGMASAAAQHGMVSRGNSFESHAAAAAAALGGGGGAAASVGGGLTWGPKVRSAIAPGTPGSFGTLVPLSEEASYHGNTAGYAAMLLQQQQQRQQQQRQRRASQGATAASGAAAAAAAAAATSGSSAPNSLHGAAGRPESCSESSPHAGINPMWGVSLQPGVSPLGPHSPAMNSTNWPADELTPGSVRLRLLSDDHGLAGNSAPMANGGGGDTAIAAAAARLNRQVPERNGCLVRMSAPQPSPLSPPPTGTVLLGDESPSDTDSGCAAVPDLAAATCSNSAASNTVQQQPTVKHPDECHSLLKPPPTLQPLQLRVSRPSSATKLPPIIAVARHPPAAAATTTASAAAAEAARGGGPWNATATGGGDGAADNTPAPPPGAGGSSREEIHGLASGSIFSGERRTSLHDAVPLVGIDGSDGVVVSGTGRRSRAGMLCPGTPPPPVLSGVHAQVVTPPPSLGEAGGGGGGAAPSTNPRFDRQSSQKSIGSNRSGTGNGCAPCGTSDGAGTATGGALSPMGAGSGGQLSIAALLQGRYEQDFQWVWRLTGQTGSCMYMAPEVYRNMPYNEKVDVFSFGVLMYEVFSRTLLLVAALNLKELRLKGMNTPEGYAQYVAEGYRPPKPLAMPNMLYELISACWADDPCARPNMVDVVESLRILQEQYAPEPTSSAPSCGCIIC